MLSIWQEIANLILITLEEKPEGTTIDEIILTSRLVQAKYSVGDLAI